MVVAALIGEPATGKSTMAKQLLERLGPGRPFKRDLLNGTRHGNTFVFGSYDPNQVFSGTDRLSMACQPSAVKFLEDCKLHNPEAKIFFEGDRLGNISFLEKCFEFAETHVFVLAVSNQEKILRHHARQDNQSEKFLAGRMTKIANILKRFPQSEILPNENLDQMARNVELISRLFASPE